MKYGSNGNSAWLLMIRFLDDFIKLFVGTIKQLHIIFDEMNKIHPNLKFTLNHTTQKMNQRKIDVTTSLKIQYLFWTLP